MAEPILEIRNLKTGFVTESGIVKALDGVSITIEKGQVVCLVGESGSGKSVTSLNVMRLSDYDGGIVLEGGYCFTAKTWSRRARRTCARSAAAKLR